MHIRYKVLLGSVASGLVLAIVWTAIVTGQPGILKDFLAAFALISLLAAPIDLVAAFIAWWFKRKEWALGLLFSGLLYSLVLAISYTNIKLSTP